MATTDTCLPRLRVFLDASLLTALVLTGLALRRRVVSSGPPSKPDDLYYDHLNRTFRRSVAGSPSVGDPGTRAGSGDRLPDLTLARGALPHAVHWLHVRGRGAQCEGGAAHHRL
ncbi:hypothetical protein PR003_g6732 [Phytophthora rubi]|uniref:Uncharacterized protein n=1 Tax=Phytophthora rubi TaxID=129364 RepID=A0A6A3NIB9_9STRA|nr:hypothetical protein PF003_g33089 [Phytophthora fragariae]KAE9043053.1 hypothetical protein PR001_g5959 [Phytophthora rubi]KAE9347786.1 hypothetical protein PR003_g6732 [Phytophthora rubi]